MITTGGQEESRAAVWSRRLLFRARRYVQVAAKVKKKPNRST
jgi:hypothetical protein